MIGLREQLVLLLIARTTSNNIHSLVNRLDSADFPGNATKSLNILIENDFIIVIEYYFGNPIRYASTEKGELFLKNYIDKDELNNYVKGMSEPGVLLEVIPLILDTKL
jgi:hypothetical protein